MSYAPDNDLIALRDAHLRVGELFDRVSQKGRMLRAIVPDPQLGGAHFVGGSRNPRAQVNRQVRDRINRQIRYASSLMNRAG